MKQDGEFYISGMIVSVFCHRAHVVKTHVLRAYC